MISEAEEAGLIQPGIYTRQAYTWAFSMLLSRLVRLPGTPALILLLLDLLSSVLMIKHTCRKPAPALDPAGGP